MVPNKLKLKIISIGGKSLGVILPKPFVTEIHKGKTLELPLPLQFSEGNLNELEIAKLKIEEWNKGRTEKYFKLRLDAYHFSVHETANKENYNEIQILNNSIYFDIYTEMLDYLNQQAISDDKQIDYIEELYDKLKDFSTKIDIEKQPATATKWDELDLPVQEYLKGKGKKIDVELWCLVDVNYINQYREIKQQIKNSELKPQFSDNFLDTLKQFHNPSDIDFLYKAAQNDKNKTYTKKLLDDFVELSFQKFSPTPKLEKLKKYAKNKSKTP